MGAGNPTIGQRAVDRTIVNHERRIKVLESQTARVSTPDVWTDITLGEFTNGWLPLINGIEDSPGYIISATNWLKLRGRVYSGSDGLPAFTLPFAPPNAHTFVGDLSTGTFALGSGGVGGNTGAIVIDDAGHVIPFISPPGWLSSVPYNLLTGGTIGLESLAYWINGSGNIYEMLSGAFAVKGGSTPAAVGAIYTGGQQHTDAELEATISGATEVYMGLRCQLPYTPGSMNYPAGYWLDCPHSAGGTITMKIYDIFGVGVDYAAGATSPGFTTGDVITFRINYGCVEALKNGIPFFQVQPGSDQSHVWSSGFFGFGANGTHGTSLASALVGRLPKNVGVSLENCWLQIA